MQKAPETALFLLWLLLSHGERDLQQPVPLCPGRGPQNPVYRASHSFFISTPLKRDLSDHVARVGADHATAQDLAVAPASMAVS